MNMKNTRYLKKIVAISDYPAGPAPPTPAQQRPDGALAVNRKLRELAISLAQLRDLPKKNLSLPALIEETIDHCSQIQLGLSAAVLFEIRPLIDHWMVNQTINLIGKKTKVVLSGIDTQRQPIQAEANQIILWVDTTQQLLRLEHLLKPLEKTTKKALAIEIGRWIESQTLWFQWNALQNDSHLSLADIESLKHLPIVMSWHTQFKRSSFCLFMNGALKHMVGDLTNHNLAEKSADVIAELGRINKEFWADIQVQIDIVHLMATKRDFQAVKKKISSLSTFVLF